MNQITNDTLLIGDDFSDFKAFTLNETSTQHVLTTQWKSTGFFSANNVFVATSLFHLDNMFVNSVLIVVTAFVLVCSVVKLSYRSRLRYLDYLPEPITILLIGVLFGGVANYYDVQLRYFNDQTFFVIFLPPIIFEAVLNIHRKYFIRHLLVILIFGFIGTLSTIFLVGSSLWLINEISSLGLGDLNPHPVAFYLFAILVGSVDSVIIIGILGEMQVHPSLYFIFIGESMINDGVTLIVFDYIHSFGCALQAQLSFNPWAVMGLCSFVLLIKVFGSCILGATFGSITAFLTKYTYKHTLVEPLIVLSAGYLTYLFDYGVSWHGVFALLVFGIIQTVYTFENISGKSRITIKRLAHMTAEVAESLIILTIGYRLAKYEQVWNGKFIAVSMLLCIIWRVLVVFVLATMTNWMRSMTMPITQTMKFVIGFCGLRGAVSHSLVEIINPKCLQAVGVNPNMYQTTAVFITFFTIVIIGVFLRPLLRLLQTRFEKQSVSLMTTLNEEVIQKAINAVEEIAGLSEASILKNHLKNFNQRYVRPILLRDSTPPDRILEDFRKITIALHYASLQSGKLNKPIYSTSQQGFKKLQFRSTETSTAAISTTYQQPEHCNLREDNRPSLSGFDAFMQTDTLWRTDTITINLNTLLSEPELTQVGRRKRSKHGCAHSLKQCVKQFGAVCSCCPGSNFRRDNQSLRDIEKYLQQKRQAIEELQTMGSTAVDVADFDHLTGPSVQRYLTDSSSPPKYSSTITTTSDTSPETSGCSKCMPSIMSITMPSQTPSKHSEVSRLLINRRYNTQESVSYLDHIRQTIHLKQNALRIQQTVSKGSIYRRLSRGGLPGYQNNTGMYSDGQNVRAPDIHSTSSLRMPECFITSTSEMTGLEESKKEKDDTNS